MAVSQPPSSNVFGAPDAAAAHRSETAWERPVSLKLMVAARLLRKNFDYSAGNVGITRAQWSTIAAVASAEGATQRKIATMLDIGEAVAGRHIDRLCDEGWLERRQASYDRRAHCIHLTPAATPVLEKLAMLGERQELVTFAGLSEAELRMFGKTLDRILDNLSDALGGERSVSAEATPAVLGAL